MPFGFAPFDRFMNNDLNRRSGDDHQRPSSDRITYIPWNNLVIWIDQYCLKKPPASIIRMQVVYRFMRLTDLLIQANPPRCISILTWS
jgi:hypothetical protein